MVPNGTQRSPMATNGNQWYQIVPNGTKLYLMVPKVTIHLMFLFPLTWQLLGETNQTQSSKLTYIFTAWKLSQLVVPHTCFIKHQYFSAQPQTDA